MRWFYLLLCLLIMTPAIAAGPVMVMHQVVAGESWRALAARYQLSERRLRFEFNRERFLVPLAPGDWVWVPNKSVPRKTPLTDVSAVSPVPARTSTLPVTDSVALPVLGRPDPALAPKSDELLLTLASAARAAASDDIDSFLLSQTELLAEDTLSFGTSQLAALPWLNPSDWYWDYQLPLFDRDARANTQLALPVNRQLNSELGIDYRDDRLTYQLGLHYRRDLPADNQLHLQPLFDYQDDTYHRRGGVLLWMQHQDLRLGAAQYRPLSPWYSGERPAAGRVWFGEGNISALPGLSISGRYYQWQGRQLQLFGSGDKYKAAASRQWSLSYAPWRILRLQTSVLNNSEDEFESRIRLMFELPLRLSPGLWWRPAENNNLEEYRPLQYHRVLVLEHR